MKMIYAILVLVILLIFGGMVTTYSSEKTSRQPFRSILKEDKFEIRYYPEAIMASVKMNGTYDESKNSGFRALAGYIFGGNSQNMKISMTSPVRMNDDGTSSTMSFVMPSGLTFENLPKPKNPDVIIHKSQPVYAAVLKFGGYASDRIISSMNNKLKTILEEKGLPHSGKFEFLGYNPPFQVVNRQNEVFVELTGFKE